MRRAFYLCNLQGGRMDKLQRAMRLVAKHGLAGRAQPAFSEPTRRTLCSRRENRGQLTRDLLPPAIATNPDD
jgi:hypothetical protein